MRAFRITTLAVLSLLATLTLGSAQSTPRRLDRALAAQQELAAQRPDDPAVLNDLGNLLALAGDTRGAEAAYRRALELAPDDAGAHFNYGLLLAESGERLAALRQFRTVTDLEPRHAWAWYQIGEIWDAWRQDRLARRAYARAFRLDPSLADARANPSVLDNDQATVAMLMAWRGGLGRSAAPRSYAEGGRIATLLLDLPPVVEPLPPPAEEAAGDLGGGITRVTPLAGEEAELEADPVPGDRVITGSDLRTPLPSNQVDSKEPVSRTPTVRPGGRPTPARPRYVPGPDSSGRLEPRLLPADPDSPAVSG